MATPQSSETTPLLEATATVTASPGPASPDSGFPRPKPPRSVTFHANPVSETFEAESRQRPRTTLPSSSSGRLHHGQQQHHAHDAPTSSLAPLVGAPASGGAPMLSALNSRLRRRNSNGGTPVAQHVLPGGPSSLSLAHGGVSGPVAAAANLPKVGPQRSTKNAQKLKILPNPETGEEEDEDEESGRDVYSQYARIKDPSARRDAARLGKADRDRLPRVTAYSTANKYDMNGLMRFLKGRGKTRGANPKLIDECIYTPFHYGFGSNNPNGHGRSSWDDRRAGGRDAVFAREARPGGVASPLIQSPGALEAGREDPMAAAAATAHDGRPQKGEGPAAARLQTEDSGYGEEIHSRDRDRDDGGSAAAATAAATDPDAAATFGGGDGQNLGSPLRQYGFGESVFADASPISPVLSHLPAPSLLLAPPAVESDFFLDIEVHTPEVFLFEYGVVVIWGMSAAQEEKFLKEMARFEIEKLARDEVQAEFFNFYYTREYQPRIYNDFITLRDKNNYKTKLAISHGLAQSVKTSLFEELLASEIETCKDLPAQIAVTGAIALTRAEINMKIGELFILRINIHLNGSILDTPELFWVEPQLEPLYQAVRSYLEMDQRVSLLTSRLDVIADLLAVLKDQLNHGHGEKLEWIVIILIAAEILVAAINIYVDLYVAE